MGSPATRAKKDVADASGAAHAAVMAALACHRLRRALVFGPTKGPIGSAKVRPRTLATVCELLYESARVAVVWRYAGSSDLQLWVGTVRPIKAGRIWLDYGHRCFPFPPTDVRVVVMGVSFTVAKAPRADHRWGSRALTPVIGHPGDTSDDDKHYKAMKGTIPVGTLNVTTLRLAGVDAHSIRRCARLQEVNVFMESKGRVIWVLQEVRFRFDGGPVTVTVDGFRYFFTSADAKGGGGLAIVASPRLIAALVFNAVSHRIATCRVQAIEPVLLVNVHAPTAADTVEEHEDFRMKFLEACVGRFVLPLGDFNAPLQRATGPLRDATCPASERMRGLLRGAALASAFSHREPRDRRWTFVFPNGGKKQLDHVCVSRRFLTSVRSLRVWRAPVPTGHCAVTADVKIRWASQRVAKKPVPWYQLEGDGERDRFAQRVKQYISEARALAGAARAFALPACYADASVEVQALVDRAVAGGLPLFAGWAHEMPCLEYAIATHGLCQNLQNIKNNTIPQPVGWGIYCEAQRVWKAHPGHARGGWRTMPLWTADASDVAELDRRLSAIVGRDVSVPAPAERDAVPEPLLWSEIAAAARCAAAMITPYKTVAVRWAEGVAWCEGIAFAAQLVHGGFVSHGLCFAAKPGCEGRQFARDIAEGSLGEKAPASDLSSLRKIFVAARSPVVFEKIQEHHMKEIEATITQECEMLETNMRRAPAQAWRYLQGLAGTARPKFQAEGDSAKERLERTRKHFQGMGGDVGGDPNVRFADAPPLRRKIDDGPIVLAEVRKAAVPFDRGKASGDDELPIEALRAMLADHELGEAITQIIERVRVTGNCEDVWRMVMQVPIPKKGNLLLLANWRPICLVNAIVKLSNRVAMNRIQELVDEVLRDSQYGFRRNRSTAGAQAALSEVMGRAIRAKDGVVIGFVDFSKAFPSISFAAIKEALRAFHVPVNIAGMIMALYKDVKGFVRTPEGNTETFNIETGTLQGDVLAPFLFIMVLDRVLAEALDGFPEGLVILKPTGTKSRPTGPGVKITDIDYADDLAIMALRVKDLERMLERLYVVAGKVNLKLNVGPLKTAYMIVGKIADADCALNVEGLGAIPRVTQYRHLGTMKKEEDGSSSFKDRMHLTWAAMHKMKPIWGLRVGIPLKLRLFNAMVMPILLYGSGSWVLSRKEAEAADVEINRMRRMVCDVQKYRVAVESLYAGVRKFSTMQRVERVKIVGHLLRHECPFTLAIQWEPDGRRGRTRTMAEACAVDLHLRVDELSEHAQNRKTWASRTDELSAELEPRQMYVPVWSPQWAAAVQRCQTMHDRQFVEEGNRAFPRSGADLHSYSDGSRIGDDDGRSATGYAAIPLCDVGLKSVCAPLLDDKDQTNNRAEILGAMASVRLGISVNRITWMHTDSGVVWYWYHHQRRQLRLVRYATLENSDLWIEFDRLLHQLPGHGCIKVRSHNGNPWNDEADLVAGLASQTSAMLRYPGEPRIMGPVHGPLLPFDKSLEALGRQRVTSAARKKAAAGKATIHENVERRLDFSEPTNVLQNPVGRAPSRYGLVLRSRSSAGT